MNSLLHIFSMLIERLSDCLTTPKHKNKSAIGCHINGIFLDVSHI